MPDNRPAVAYYDRTSDALGFAIGGWEIDKAKPVTEHFDWGQVDSWGALLFQAVVIAIFTYWIWYNMMRRYPVNQVMPFTLLLPMIGVGSLYLRYTRTDPRLRPGEQEDEQGECPREDGHGTSVAGIITSSGVVGMMSSSGLSTSWTV